MKVLLLHPEDSPRRGPWTRERWDLVVDLGKSSESTAGAWQELVGCPVLRLESFRRGMEDPRRAGKIFRTGFGQLEDACGLDWWELTSLFVHAELETVLAVQRLVASNELSGEMHSTRPDWPVSALHALGIQAARSFSESGQNSWPSQVRRYARAFQRLGFSAALDVAYDKYDAGYEWRSRLTARPRPAADPIVLLPSAYKNVSRMSAAYASLLPDQNFLVVATRRSGLEFNRPSNVKVAHLAGYATPTDHGVELAALLKNWDALRIRLERTPELHLLASAGVLDPFPKWFGSGLRVRDAWRAVLDREPVVSVLCGDDSNWYTRLPVLLARKRGLPTVDFHHGAFDGRFLIKNMSSQTYLAKSEMERDYLLRVCGLPADYVVVGAPDGAPPHPISTTGTKRSAIVFFSEPSESVGGRSEEIYRELMPPLLRVADEHAKILTVKLHPFENLQERSSLLELVLGAERRARVKLVDGPLNPELLATAWCGVTVESTTVVDCTRNAVPCFLCEWLAATRFGYVQQFTRFGVGRLLRSANEVSEIPRMLSEATSTEPLKQSVGQQIGGDMLRKLLAGPATPVSG